jgi:general secretion pathway protein H
VDSRVRRRRRAASERGVTLVELMIVIVIIALVSGGMLAGSGQLASVRLKRSATVIAGGVKVAFTRATVTSKSVRMVFDIDASKVWLEEADQPMLVTSRSKVATGGDADPVTEAEKAAVAESDRIVKGAAKPTSNFKAIKAMGFVDPENGSGGRELGRNIKIRSVETPHDDEPRTSGRAYLYFWPGGQTERASIQLRIGTSTDDDETLSLIVSPLTGKVTIKNGSIAIERTTDKDGSEREDREF